MKREAATAISEQAITELSEQLSQGKTEELEKYLTTMSTFHDYSFGNCLLIARQKPNATLVAGFRTWQKKHQRSVKKGEKGICILAPMIRKKKSDDDDESGVFGYRAVHVFDVTQTEGESLPEPNRVSGDPGAHLANLQQVAVARGISLSYADDLGGADGVSKNGSIELLCGLPSAEEFSTLAHELAHLC